MIFGKAKALWCSIKKFNFSKFGHFEGEPTSSCSGCAVESGCSGVSSARSSFAELELGHRFAALVAELGFAVFALDLVAEEIGGATFAISIIFSSVDSAIAGRVAGEAGSGINYSASRQLGLLPSCTPSGVAKSYFAPNFERRPNLKRGQPYLFHSTSRSVAKAGTSGEG